MSAKEAVAREAAKRERDSIHEPVGDAVAEETASTPVAGRHVVVVGAGNIASHVMPHLARMPEVGRVTVIDHDIYEAKNLRGQDIVPADVGKPKAAAQARRMRRINPALATEGIHAAVEEVPLGRLRADLILAGLDSRRARAAVNRAAWRLGVPWIDAGVDAAQRLVRVNTYLPGDDAPCLECGWSEEDYRELDQIHPCDDGRDRVAPTDAPSSIGAMAASLQALEAAKILAGDRDGAAGRQILFDAAHLKYHLVSFRRRAECRMADHAPWRIDSLGADPGRMPLRELAAAITDHYGSGGETQDTHADESRAGATPARGAWRLRVAERRWATEIVCPDCGGSRAGLWLVAGLRSTAGACRRCRGPLYATGFHLLDELDLDALSRRDGARTLKSVGIRRGDVLSFVPAAGRGVPDGGPVRHVEISNPNAVDVSGADQETTRRNGR